MVQAALSIKHQENSYLVEQSCWDATLYDLGGLSCYFLGLYEKSLEYTKIAMDLAPDDERLKNCIESFNEVLQVIVGKKKLESNSQIPQYTMEIRKKLIDTTKEFSISFMEIYGPLMKELYLIQQEVMKKAQTK